MTGYPCEYVRRVNPPLICVVVCEDAVAVGMPEHGGKKPNQGACGRCAYYDPIVPPVFQFERHASISEMNDPIPKCGSKCLYGADLMDMCGGCCACLGGCQVEHENQQVAPYLWEGDYA